VGWGGGDDEAFGEAFFSGRRLEMEMGSRGWEKSASRVVRTAWGKKEYERGWETVPGMERGTMERNISPSPGALVREVRNTRILAECKWGQRKWDVGSGYLVTIAKSASVPPARGKLVVARGYRKPLGVAMRQDLDLGLFNYGEFCW